MRRNQYNKKSFNVLSVILCMGVLLCAGLRPADALPVLQLSDGITTLTIEDQSTNDTNTNPGIVRFNKSLGVFNILVTIGATKPALGSAALPEMDLFSLVVNSSDAGTLTVRFSDTDFGPSFNGSLTSELGATTDGTVWVDTYVDETNALFGTGTGIGSFGPITDTYLDPPLLAEHAVSMTDFFSLTSIATIMHDNAGDQSSFDLFIESRPVPEPGTMTMLLAGFSGVMVFGRKARCLNRRSAP